MNGTFMKQFKKALVLIVDLFLVYAGDFAAVKAAALLGSGDGKVTIGCAIVLELVFLILFAMMEMYEFKSSSAREVFVTAMISIFGAVICTEIIALITPIKAQSALAALFAAVLALLFVAVWRIALYVFIAAFLSEKNILVVESKRVPSRMVRKMKYTFEGKKQVRYYILDDDDPQDVEYVLSLAKNFDSIVLSEALPKRAADKIFKAGFLDGKKVSVIASLHHTALMNGQLCQFGDTPIISTKGKIGPTKIEAFCKRAFDIVFSLIAMVILSPIIAVCAAAIKLDSEGPVIYKQERYTIGKRVFNVYKFRTMVVDAEKNGAQLLTKDDDRLTRVGRIIRSMRLDEIPQLWNIFNGTMSFVGPRPERPCFADEYCEKVENYTVRYKIKAGLTGYAQVYGNYGSRASDKILMDVIYATDYSFMLDMKLILLTVRSIFIHDSSEGVSPELELLDAPEKEHERKMRSREMTEDK